MAKTYHIPYAIISEERKIEQLNRRMAQYKRSCVWGIVMLLVSCYFLIESYVLIGKLFGLVLFLASARRILRYFFNRGCEWTEEIMRSHQRESIAMQIRTCEDTIENLKEQAKEQEAKELARRREKEAARYRAAEQGTLSDRVTEAVHATAAKDITVEQDGMPAYDGTSEGGGILEQNRSEENGRALACDGLSSQDGAYAQNDMPGLDKIEERFTL